jgi:hypothetical protein
MTLSDSNDSITITIIIVGAGYFTAATVATIALIATVAAIALPIVAVVVTLLGLYSYLCYFRQAVQTRNWHWAVDILLAPAIAFGVVLSVPSTAQVLWATTLGTMKSAAQGGSALLVAPIGLALAFSVFAAPYYAVTLMGDETRIDRRLGSYVAFAWTAGFWGLLALSFASGGNWLEGPPTS